MFSLPFQVQRSVSIAKPISDVFNVIADFNTWPKWSPWLCQEPDCPFDVSGEPGNTGHAQQWNGKRIGSGEMLIEEINQSKNIQYELRFLKPWKSKSKVIFNLSQEGDLTKVSWIMHGSLPIFMFFMKKMMTSLVGSDYERGLSMLKDYIETGEVLSDIKIKGKIPCDGFYYLGKRRTCKTADVGTFMEQDFGVLKKLLDENKVPTPDLIFSFYHQYDFVKLQCEYTSGFGYKSKPDFDQVANLETGEMPQHQALNVLYTGSYRHLGNGWMTLYGLLRAEKEKQSKSLPMYEIYRNMPGEVEEKDLLTDIFMPVK